MKFDAYIGEFLGTAALVLSILVLGNPMYITLAFGLIIYSLGKVSGGHINPAVSIAMFVKGKQSLENTAGYIVSQVVGGVLAVYMYKMYA